MRNVVKFTLAALTAALALSWTVGTASARNFSISNQNIRATWRNLEFVAPGLATIRCPATLEGSFNARTIAKVVGSLIGALSLFFFKQTSCTGGTLAAFNGRETYNGSTTANTMGWHRTYKGFTGTLPIDILRLRYDWGRFRFGATFTTFGSCIAQYGSELDEIEIEEVREAGGALTSLTPVEGANIMTKIREDDPFNACPRELDVTGTSTSLTVQGSTARLTLTLI